MYRLPAVRQEGSNLLADGPPTEQQGSPQVDPQKAEGGPQDRSQAHRPGMVQQVQPHQTAHHQTGELGAQNPRRKSHRQGRKTGAQVFRDQERKELPGTHPHHHADPKLMAPPLHLIPAGPIDQEKENDQGKAKEQREHGENAGHAYTLYLAEKHHDILFCQRKDHVKGNYRYQKGGEKESILLPTPAAVAQSQLKQHGRSPLPAGPSPGGCTGRSPLGSPGECPGAVLGTVSRLG